MRPFASTPSNICRRESFLSGSHFSAVSARFSGLSPPLGSLVAYPVGRSTESSDLHLPCSYPKNGKKQRSLHSILAEHQAHKPSRKGCHAVDHKPGEEPHQDAQDRDGNADNYLPRPDR